MNSRYIQIIPLPVIGDRHRSIGAHRKKGGGRLEKSASSIWGPARDLSLPSHSIRLLLPCLWEPLRRAWEFDHWSGCALHGWSTDRRAAGPIADCLSITYRRTGASTHPLFCFVEQGIEVWQDTGGRRAHEPNFWLLQGGRKKLKRALLELSNIERLWVIWWSVGWERRPWGHISKGVKLPWYWASQSNCKR